MGVASSVDIDIGSATLDSFRSISFSAAAQTNDIDARHSRDSSTYVGGKKDNADLAQSGLGMIWISII
jgi:hypothetical protein